jgi:two-component system, chemotaxis family, chemotaxis protein CheY
MSDASVLVIDDDVDLCDSLRDVLEQAGYQVTTAANGREALAAVRSSEPQLVLLDLMMPIMNGFEFLAVFHEKNPHVPVIVMSAHVEDAPDLPGVSASLRKPFSGVTLRQTVRRYAASD